MSDIATLSIAEIKALLAEKVDAEKKAENEVKAALAVFGEDFIEHVIAEVASATTESTGRVGRSVVGMPYTGKDGVQYSVSIHVTDVKASEAGKAAVKAKKEAEERAAKDKAAAAALGIK